MQIDQMSLLDFVGREDAVFAIPRFQRTYSWESEQCDELWRDVLRAARARRSHFVGTLIYVEESLRDDGTHVLTVVDGQQRLTTLSLILLALARHLDATGESLFGIGSEQIARSYLRNGDAPKLEPSRADFETYNALVLGTAIPGTPAERMMENLERFASKMSEPDFDAMELWRGLGALTVIATNLEDRSKAPDVFESFNSKGVPLVTADLVRNYLLLAENHAEQTRLFETYWEPIQGMFGDDPGSIRLNNAILGWLTVRFKKIRKFGDAQAFSIFKSFCEDEYDGTVDDLLDELFSFCMVWAENYRFHAVKKFRSADWAKLGRKTRVSDRPLKEPDNPGSREYYKRHFGVDAQW